MKITRKIGNDYYTVEDGEIDKFCPRTFKEAFLATIIGTAAIMGVLLLIHVVGEVLQFIFM